jgi:hypothetical protein
MTRLDLHDHRTILSGDDLPTVTLAVGIRRLAAGVFRQDPPAPAEIEHAIDLLEDALTASGLRQLPRGDLVNGDPVLLAMLDLNANGARRSRDEVEDRFNRLADASMGRRSVATGLPPGREGAAALLILRECMHHLGFDGIRRAAA